MTQSNLITTCHYQQLSAEERGQIQMLHKDNYSMRVIAVYDFTTVRQRLAANSNAVRFVS